MPKAGRGMDYGTEGKKRQVVADGASGRWLTPERRSDQTRFVFSSCPKGGTLSTVKVAIARESRELSSGSRAELISLGFASFRVPSASPELTLGRED